MSTASVESLVQAVRKRMTARRLLSAALPSAALIGCGALLAYYFSAYSRLIGVLLIVASLALAALLAARRGLLRTPSQEDASLLIDAQLNTKERITTLRELAALEQRPEAQRLLSRQLSASLESAKAEDFVSFALSSSEKFFLGAALLTWGTLIISLLLRLGNQSGQHGFLPDWEPSKKAAEELRELIKEAPTLPLGLQNSLAKLADTIDEKGLNAPESKQALESAQEQLSGALSKDASKTAASGQKSSEASQNTPSSSYSSAGANLSSSPRNSSSISSPENRSSSQSSRASSAEASSSSLSNSGSRDAQQSSQSVDIQHGTQAEAQKPKEKPDGDQKSGQKEQSSGQESKANQSEQSNQSAAQKEAGSPQSGQSGSPQSAAQQGSDSANQQSPQGGQGSQRSANSNGAQSASGADQNGSSGQSAAAQSGGSAGSAQNSGQNGSQGSADSASNENQQSQEIAKAAQVLKNIEKQAQKPGSQSQGQGSSGGEQGSSQASRSDGSQGQQTGSALSQSNQGGSQANSAPNQKNGRTQGSSRNQSSAISASDSAGGASQGSSNDQRSNDSSDNQDGQDNQEGKAADSSLNRKNPEMKDFAGDQGKGSNYALHGKTQLKDEAIVPNQDEKFDTRFTGGKTGDAKNEAGAQPKTALSDVQLARPETVKEHSEQPIPLEYQDLLK